MDQQSEHQAFFNAKAAYEESKTKATERKLFNAMLPYLKQAAAEGDYEYFIRTLNEMDHFGFLETAPSANQIVWSIIALLNKLKSSNEFPLQLFEILFELLAKLNHKRPSLEHSLLMKFFLKRADHYQMFEQFLNWWDIKNLRPEDYESEKFKEALFPPLAETLYVELSKSILTNAENSQPLGPVEKNFLITLAKELDGIYLQHPHYKYFPYYSARLQFAAGFTKGAFQTILPFVRHNISQFWVWELLADFFVNDISIQRAIYCRAMLCRADDQMKTGLQTKLLNVFLKCDMKNEAHEELDKIIRIMERRNSKTLPDMLSYRNNDWYKDSTNLHESFHTYQKYAPEAEDALFFDQPQKIAVINAYLPDRGLVFIVTEDLVISKFKTSRFKIHNAEPGMLLQVVTESIEGNIEVLQARPANVKSHEKLVQIVEGKLKLMNDGAFGIVSSVYVPHDLILETRIQDGSLVFVKALRSYDKKKDNWGWKAISMATNID